MHARTVRQESSPAIQKCPGAGMRTEFVGGKASKKPISRGEFSSHKLSYTQSFPGKHTPYCSLPENCKSKEVYSLTVNKIPITE